MAVKRGQLTLVALFSVFVLPFFAAWWLLMHPQWLPAARSNHGALIKPPLATGFRGEWTLVVPAGARCEEECRKLRSVATVVWYALTPESRQLTAVADCASESKSACTVLAGAIGQEPALLVVDPMGNAVLRYGSDVTPRALLQDVQRLQKAASYWRHDGNR